MDQSQMHMLAVLMPAGSLVLHYNTGMENVKESVGLLRLLLLELHVVATTQTSN